MLVFGIYAAAVMGVEDGTATVEKGVEADVPGSDRDDGKVLIVFWEPPCPTAEKAA